jgi:hypothetical protein
MATARNFIAMLYCLLICIVSSQAQPNDICNCCTYTVSYLQFIFEPTNFTANTSTLLSVAKDIGQLLYTIPEYARACTPYFQYFQSVALISQIQSTYWNSTAFDVCTVSTGQCSPDQRPINLTCAHCDQLQAAYTTQFQANEHAFPTYTRSWPSWTVPYVCNNDTTTAPFFSTWAQCFSYFSAYYTAFWKNGINDESTCPSDVPCT